jgi:hypothetical protein
MCYLLMLLDFKGKYSIRAREDTLGEMKRNFASHGRKLGTTGKQP